MPASVAILGCGPAGLFAAQALTLHGIQPAIISQKQKSLIYGAQYLHKRIPGLTPVAPQSYITTYYLGDPTLYARRVYGVDSAPTSWPAETDGAPVGKAIWNLRAAYDWAWKTFESRIVDQMLDYRDVRDFELQFDLVISTIPLWRICAKPRGHSFYSRPTLYKQSI